MPAVGGVEFLDALAREVRRRRVALGISEADLGRRSGLNISAIKATESAEDIPLEVFVRIAQGLGTDAPRLLSAALDRPTD